MTRERQVRGALGVHLPFEPLWACARPASVRALADRVGVSSRAVQRWKREGVPMVKADKIACAIGQHPSAIWGDGWDSNPVDNGSGSVNA